MNLRVSNGTMTKQRGFTLVELMVVVAIVAILAAIAVPLYNEQVRKARRGTAKSDMMELVQELERFHTVNATYAGFAPVLVNSPDDGTVSYQIAVNDLTATGYTLVATAQDDQVADMCGDITLNQTGEPSFSTGHTKSECWNR